MDSFAAGLVAVFGMVDAVAILGSGAVLATALDVADDKSLAVPGGAAATAQLLHVISGHLWRVGGLFFCLWLILMGWLVVRSRWLPRSLSQLVMVGGVGYLLSTFVSYVFANADLVAGLLTVPATIGELDRRIPGAFSNQGPGIHERTSRTSAVGPPGRTHIGMGGGSRVGCLRFSEQLAPALATPYLGEMTVRSAAHGRAQCGLYVGRA